MPSQHFAQLSDPHLSTPAGARLGDLIGKRGLGYLSWRRRRRFEHRREVLEALCSDLAGLDCSQVLVTGDLTHIGLPSEFDQAASWLAQLGPPEQVAVIPGNHDACVSVAPELGLLQWRDYLASDNAAGGSFPSLRVRGHIAFIGLSTACPTPPLMASGTLGNAQLADLAALLEQQAGRFRVVYLHHSPVAGAEIWRKRLTDAAGFRRVIAEQGAELVLHGHGHRARWEEIESPQGKRPVIAVPSASARGLHGADRAAYNRYSVSPADGGWELQVASRCYDPDSGEVLDGERRKYTLRN